MKTNTIKTQSNKKIPKRTPKNLEKQHSTKKKNNKTPKNEATTENPNPPPKKKKKNRPGEFVELIRQMRIGVSRESAAELFTLLDTDCNGRPEPTERCWLFGVGFFLSFV